MATAEATKINNNKKKNSNTSKPISQDWPLQPTGKKYSGDVVESKMLVEPVYERINIERKMEDRRVNQSPDVLEINE